MNSINLNFNMERDAEYPENLDKVLSASNEEIINWINTLPIPETDLEASLFNEIFNQFQLKGGKA